MNYLPKETPPKFCKYCKADMLEAQPRTVVSGFDPLTGEEQYYTYSRYMYCSNAKHDYHPKWYLIEDRWVTS